MLRRESKLKDILEDGMNDNIVKTVSVEDTVKTEKIEEALGDGMNENTV